MVVGAGYSVAALQIVTEIVQRWSSVGRDVAVVLLLLKVRPWACCGFGSAACFLMLLMMMALVKGWMAQQWSKEEWFGSLVDEYWNHG